VSTIDCSLRFQLDFLVHKYPPSRHKIVDTELGKHIPEMRRHTDIQYDMLRNAAVTFTTGCGIKHIKLWLNKLVT